MIGEQIKYFRQQKHVKQDELAEYLGVTFQAVSKWETGSSTPDISLLPKIAVFFGVSIDELFEMPYEEQMNRIENMFWHERRINEQTFNQTVAYLEKVLRENPGDTRAMSNLAYLYNHRAAADHATASLYASKVLELDPDDKSGWVAFLEANNGVCGDEWYDNHFDVITYFREFLDKNPMNYLGLYALIENMLADARYDEALPYIEQMKKAKKNHQYLLYLGDVAFGKGDPVKARATWERMIEEFPDVWQAYCSLGDGYLKLNEWEKALDLYEKSFTMQESPRIYDGLCSMGQIFEMRELYPEAVSTYRRIIDCLRQDYGVMDGEQIDRFEREISRLKKKY